MSDQAEQRKSMWAIVELMGHQRMAGFVSEDTFAGAGMIRIDVPKTPKSGAYTRYVSPASVYAINPTTEELATKAAEAFQPRPVNEWELPLSLPPARDSGELGKCEGCDQPAVGHDNEGIPLCRKCLDDLARCDEQVCPMCKTTGPCECP